METNAQLSKSLLYKVKISPKNLVRIFFKCSNGKLTYYTIDRRGHWIHFRFQSWHNWKTWCQFLWPKSPPANNKQEKAIKYFIEMASCLIKELRIIL